MVNKHDKFIEHVRRDVNDALTAHAESSKSSVVGRAFRSALMLVPFGIGSAIDVQIFGAIQDRQIARLEDACKHLALSVENHQDLLEQIYSEDWFSSEYFEAAFIPLFKRISEEPIEKKREYLKNALVTVVLKSPGFTNERAESFIRFVIEASAIHVLVLNFLHERKSTYIQTKHMYKNLDAKSESDQFLLFSAIDDLANKGYVFHGDVPQKTNGQVNRERQKFRITQLGEEFLSFIRES